MPWSLSTLATYTAVASVEHLKGLGSQSCQLKLALVASCGCALTISMSCSGRITSSGSLYPTRDFNLTQACPAHTAMRYPAENDFFLLLSTSGNATSLKRSTTASTARAVRQTSSQRSG